MDIAAFVFAGGILLMGVAAIVIFSENRRRAAQLVEWKRDQAARRAHPRVAGEASARRRTTVAVGAGRRAFVEPEIRDCGIVMPREATRDRTAA